jgi:hypothetical protein
MNLVVNDVDMPLIIEWLLYQESSSGLFIDNDSECFSAKATFLMNGVVR